MSLLRNIADGLRSLFRQERVGQELDEELHGFLEMAAEEKMKQGMHREEALRAVRLERGNPEVTKEIVRSAGWELFVDLPVENPPAVPAVSTLMPIRTGFMEKLRRGTEFSLKPALRQHRARSGRPDRIGCWPTGIQHVVRHQAI